VGLRGAAATYDHSMTEIKPMNTKTTHGERTNTATQRCALACAVLLAVLTCGIFARAALGQGVVSARVAASVPVAQVVDGSEPDAVTLARACVAEADFATVDCRAILHVLGRRASRSGESVAALARRYVSGFRVPSPRIAWVMALASACDEPAGWPTGLRWESRRAKCLAVFGLAAQFVASPASVDDPCAGAADHWGAPGGRDLQRAVGAGWQRVRCEGTANAFWRLKR